MGLLCPTQEGKGERWYYDDDAVRRLTAIRVFVEAGFERKTIKEILDSPNTNLADELESVINTLEEKRKQIEHTIEVAKLLQISANMPEGIRRTSKNIDLLRIINSKSPDKILHDGTQKLGAMSSNDKSILKKGVPVLAALMSIGAMNGRAYDMKPIRNCIIDYNKCASEITLEGADNSFVAEYEGYSEYEKNLLNAIFGVLMAEDLFEESEGKKTMEQWCGEGAVEYIMNALMSYGDSICEEAEPFSEIVDYCREEWK